MAVAKLQSIVLETNDVRALAHFYRELTGMTASYEDDEWITLEAPGISDLCFQRAPGHKPPAWPDEASSMQYHFDFVVEDLDAAEAEALRLGATKFAHQPGENFRVFADPSGHVFCLCQ